MLHPGKLPMCQIWKPRRWEIQDGCTHGIKPCGMPSWPTDYQQLVNTGSTAVHRSSTEVGNDERLNESKR